MIISFVFVFLWNFNVEVCWFDVCKFEVWVEGWFSRWVFYILVILFFFLLRELLMDLLVYLGKGLRCVLCYGFVY